MKKYLFITPLLLAIAGSMAFAAEPTVRISDIARIDGMRSNQLVGYGLIVGLDGTGDTQQTVFTAQALANMLQKFGVNVPASKAKAKNIATVMVTADLPPFARPGGKIDILVSSLGDARSLQGGTLLQTPLQAANGKVYAVAQGSVSIGGFNAGGGDTTVTKNHATAGRIPGGAIVERDVPAAICEDGVVNIVLNDPDFVMTSRIAESVNAKLGAGSASAVVPGLVRVNIGNAANVVGLIADISQLPVTETTSAKVIVNERTGTVVIGDAVRISPVAISHGNLSVEISSEVQVSQPEPESKGKTVVASEKSVSVQEENARLVYLEPGNTLGELVKALNELKVSPRDMIAILQALKQAGALHADLEII